MAAGFRFNSKTMDKGDGQQWVALWIYREEFKKTLENIEETVMTKKYYYNYQEDKLNKLLSPW